MKTVYGTVIDSVLLEDGRVYVKVVDKNGHVLGGIMAGNEQEEQLRSQAVNPKEADFKVIKSDQDAKSSIKATSSYVGLLGGKTNRIVSSDKYGNFIVGPVTFTEHPESIRIGGVFRFNGMLTSTMPSTIITPMSTLVFDSPTKALLSAVSRVSKEYSELMSEIYS